MCPPRRRASTAFILPLLVSLAGTPDRKCPETPASNVIKLKPARRRPMNHLTGSGTLPDRGKEPSMSEFLFLYRGAERPSSPQDAQQIMQKWMTWMENLGKKGHLKD